MVEKRTKSREIWSDEEKAILKKLYPTASNEEILKALPGRSWESIGMRASRTKLSRVIRGAGLSWTDEEDEILKKLWFTEHSQEEIEKALPRHNWNAIRLHAPSVGLEPRGREVNEQKKIELTEAQKEANLREESIAAKRFEQLFGDLKKIPHVNIPKTDGQSPFEIKVRDHNKPSVLIVNSPLVGTLVPEKETMDIFKNSIKMAAEKNLDAILITGNLLFCLVEKYGKQRPYHTQVVGVEPDLELLESSYPPAVLKEIGPLAERIDKNKIIFMTIKVYLDSLFKAIKKKFLNENGKPIFSGNVYVVLGEMEESIAMYYANEALRAEVFREKSFAHKKIRDLRVQLKESKRSDDAVLHDKILQEINDWEVYDRLLVLMGNITPNVINDRRKQMINYLAHCIETNIPHSKVIGVGDVYIKVGKQLVSITNDKTVDSIRGGLAGRMRRSVYGYVKAHAGERVPQIILGSGMNPWGTGLYASYRIRDKKSTLDDVRMSDVIQLLPCIDSSLYRETVRRMLKAKGKVVKLANTSNFESGVAVLKFFEPAPFVRWDWYKSDFLVNDEIFGTENRLKAHSGDQRSKCVYLYKEGCTHYGASYVARYYSLQDKDGRYVKLHNQVLFEAFVRDKAPIHLYLNDGDIHHWLNYQTYKEGNIKWKDQERMLAELTKIEKDTNFSSQDKLKQIKVRILENMIVAGIIQPEDQVEAWGRAYSPYADFFKSVIDRALKAEIKIEGHLGLISIGQGNHNENSFKKGDVRFSEARMTSREIYTFLLEDGFNPEGLRNYVKACEMGGIGLTHGIFSVASLGAKAYEYCVFMKHKSGRSSKAEDNMKGMITSFSERGSTDDYEEDRFTLNFGGDDHMGGHAVTRNAFHFKTGGQMFSGPFGLKLDFPKQNLFSGVCGVAAGGPAWGPFSVIALAFRQVRKLAAYAITLPKDLFDNSI